MRGHTHYLRLQDESVRELAFPKSKNDRWLRRAGPRSKEPPAHILSCFALYRKSRAFCQPLSWQRASWALERSAMPRRLSSPRLAIEATGLLSNGGVLS